MRIAIIGAGAMGSVYAALLAEAGNEVHILDIWQDHVNAINESGLSISGFSGNRVVSSIAAHTSTHNIGLCDLVIIATKTFAVESAAKSAKEITGPRSLILTIQNGLGSADRIRSASDTPNILLGVAAGFGASVKAPGHVHHNKMQLIRLGEIEGGMTDRLEQVVAIWRNAGFNVRAFEDINQLIWEKFVCNVTYSAPCTIFNATIAEVMNDPHAWSIARTCGQEAYEAGVAKGVHFGFDDIIRYITEFGENLRDARPSMLLDHLNRRRSEIDSINGMVPVVAAEVGTRAPYNEVASAVVRSREQHF